LFSGNSIKVKKTVP